MYSIIQHGEMVSSMALRLTLGLQLAGAGACESPISQRGFRDDKLATSRQRATGNWPDGRPRPVGLSAGNNYVGCIAEVRIGRGDAASAGKEGDSRGRPRPPSSVTVADHRGT
jgi:hypothetical protein